MSVSPPEALHDRAVPSCLAGGCPLAKSIGISWPLERQGEEDEGEMEKPKEHTGNCSLGHLSHRNERLGSHENLCLNVHSCLTHKHPEAGPSRWAPQGGRVNTQCLTSATARRKNRPIHNLDEAPGITWSGKSQSPKAAYRHGSIDTTFLKRKHFINGSQIKGSQRWGRGCKRAR